MTTAPLTDEDLAEVERLAFVAGGRIAPLCRRLVAEIERLRGEVSGWAAFADDLRRRA